DMTESGKPEYKASFADWLIDNGMPSDFAQQVSDSMGDTHSMTLPHPPTLSRITAGDTIQMGERTWEMIHAPGHSDGQLIFYDRADNLLLSGDHVLMKITPNIGLWRHSQPDPLGRFMTSLRELQDLPVRLALPGHRHLIENWQGRIEELIGHHEHRLDFVREAYAAGATTPYEVTLHIFPTERFSSHEWRFAIAETLAHMAYLDNHD
ncbi:MAG: MBL fold metallo-hydrolase, partial [Aggregatilineales bacterium]